MNNQSVSLKIKNHKNKVSIPRSSKVFYAVCYIVITLMAILCLIPFIIIISSSFTSEQYISFHGFSFFPVDPTLQAYKMVFQYPQAIINAYGISIFITVFGTVLGLFITTMTAYVIGRQDFKYRNKFSFFFYFTTLFNGGMICTYIFYIRYLHLKDSLWALILPGLFSVFYLLVMRSFAAQIPKELIESAKIDGAGEYKIFFVIVIPLLKSGLATIALFIALGYWNDWYNAMLYINTSWKYPLQYMLYNILQKSQAISTIASKTGVSVGDLPTNSLKMAMACVATGPIIIVYPFVQRFFVKGITLGAVKG